MKRNGEVVAMVGGRDYKKSPFNRATQARRQPGSTFKLFVYLAALRAGMSPDTIVDDSPVEIAGWKPKNDDGRYLGDITLLRAFQRSSNVVAARLTQEVGVRNVIRAARDLGITTPIANEATIGLGTSEVSLLELTAAFAGVSEGRYPVQPHGLRNVADKSWYQALTDGQRTMPRRIHDDMLTLLAASVRGTGRAAALSVDAYGKTGTSQSGRDAWFIGFAGDLVVGVWVGNDDNTPNPGLHGGGIPAQIWRNFMVSALDLAPVVKAPVVEDIDPDAGLIADVENEIAPITAPIEGLGMDLQIGPDGSVSIARPEGPPPPRRREEREPVFEDGPPGFY
jgi:penicillin-binding protein 1A